MCSHVILISSDKLGSRFVFLYKPAVFRSHHVLLSPLDLTFHSLSAETFSSEKQKPNGRDTPFGTEGQKSSSDNV